MAFRATFENFFIFFSRYESIIATLCENLDTLDEPEARASMIWIIGEYAERIDNADELLESFLDSFQVLFFLKKNFCLCETVRKAENSECVLNVEILFSKPMVGTWEKGSSQHNLLFPRLAISPHFSKSQTARKFPKFSITEMLAIKSLK